MQRPLAAESAVGVQPLPLPQGKARAQESDEHWRISPGFTLPRDDVAIAIVRHELIAKCEK